MTTENTADVVSTLIWNDRKYRYTFLPLGEKKVPSWAVYGWMQCSNDSARIDIGNTSKHKGFPSLQSRVRGIGMDIGWKIGSRFLGEDYEYIIFSEAL